MFELKTSQISKKVYLCFDTVFATSNDHNNENHAVRILIKRGIYTCRCLIIISEYNVPIFPKIKKKIKTSENKYSEPAQIIVSVDNTVVITAEIDLRTNIIGALKSSQFFHLKLIFRLLNESTKDIVIYNVPRFKYNQFQIVRILGSGAYGEVYEVVDMLSRSYVFKIMKEMICVTNDDDNCIREIVPLIFFPNHPCLVKLEGFIFDKNHGIILILEYVSRGRIDTIEFFWMDNDVKYKILYGLFSCLAFLHEHGFIHRDIHTSNILVSENYETKLIDFGVSRFKDVEMTQDQGHQGYISPENEKSRCYNELVDEYSVGALLYNMMKNVEKRLIKKSDVFMVAIPLLLMFEDLDKRITCSEACYLIESEVFSSYSKETEKYFSELNKFHSPTIPRDISIWEFGYQTYQLRYEESSYDLIKLAVNLGVKIAEELYNILIATGNGIAFDSNFYNFIGKISFVEGIDLSVDKFEILYNFHQSHNEYPIFTNYVFFRFYHSYDFYQKYMDKISDFEIFNILWELVNTENLKAFESYYKERCLR